MKGLIFAAGLGTRLRPLTDSCPKCLIEVGGKPMLLRTAERMADAGITDIAVNVHHHSEMVKAYLAGLKIEGVSFFVSDESDLLLDTGGGLLKIAPWLNGDSVSVHNADVFTDVELSDIILSHEKSGADATLLTRPSASARALMWDNRERLHGWTNLTTGELRPPDLDVEGLHPEGFGGVHVIGPAAIEALKRYATEPIFSITPFYADMCEQLDIRSFPLGKRTWIDIGKPESLAEARKVANAQIS